MSFLVKQAALPFSTLALASVDGNNGNGADYLKIHTRKFLNLAANLETELNVGTLPKDYIEDNFGQFKDLDRIERFADEYATLELVFKKKLVAEPDAMAKILRPAIARIFDKARDILSPSDFAACTGQEISPNPPPVTEASPPPSHYTGPPTTPTYDFEAETKIAQVPQTIPDPIESEVTAETTVRTGGADTLKDPPRAPESDPSDDEDTSVDLFAGLDGVVTPKSPEVAIRPLFSAETLQSLNQTAMNKRIEGDYAGAARICQDGMQYAKSLENQDLYYMFQITLGETWRQHGKLDSKNGLTDRARILLVGAAKYLEQQGEAANLSLVTQVHPYLSMAYSDLGDYKKAVHHGMMAVRTANMSQVFRMAALAHHSVALASWGQDIADAALSASVQAVESLEKFSAEHDEFGPEILWWHGVCRRRIGDWAGAAKYIDQAYLRMRQRARHLFSNQWQRERYLMGVASHKKIESAWLNLREYMGYDTDEMVREILANLEVHTARQPSQVTDFINPDDHSIKISGEIVEKDYDLKPFIAHNGPDEPILRAGAIVDRSLEEVVRSVVTKPIVVKQNKGNAPFVSAKGISLKAFFDRDQNLFVHVSWEMSAVAQLHKTGILHPFGVKDSYEHLLAAKISKKGDLLAIELTPAEVERVYAAAKNKTEVPFDRRPDPAEFGKITFYFQAVEQDQTAVVLEFENARYTVHPEEFLSVIIRSLALAG